jgi:hypothetical protein
MTHDTRRQQTTRRPRAAETPAEAAFRAALRRWYHGNQRSETREQDSTPNPDPRDARQRPRASARPGTADPAPGGAQARRRRTPDPRAWWPRLTPTQVQALLGATITLALLLWDQVRQRLEGR